MFFSEPLSFQPRDGVDAKKSVRKDVSNFKCAARESPEWHQPKLSGSRLNIRPARLIAEAWS